MNLNLIPAIVGTVVVWVLRHAHASAKEGAPDHHRRVSHKGQDQCAAFVKKYGLISPDTVFLTELYRTHDTARGIVDPTAGPFVAIPAGYSLPIGQSVAAKVCERGYLQLLHSPARMYLDQRSYMSDQGPSDAVRPGLSELDAKECVHCYKHATSNMVNAFYLGVQQQIDLGRPVHNILALHHGNYGLGMLYAAYPSACEKLLDVTVAELNGAKVTFVDGKIVDVEVITI